MSAQHEVTVYTVSVRQGAGTYLARHAGKTASNTSGATAAAQRVLAKVYGEELAAKMELVEEYHDAQRSTVWAGLPGWRQRVAGFAASSKGLQS
jgi:hypothetical protein